MFLLSQIAIRPDSQSAKDLQSAREVRMGSLRLLRTSIGIK